MSDEAVSVVAAAFGEVMKSQSKDGIEVELSFPLGSEPIPCLVLADYISNFGRAYTLGTQAASVVGFDKPMVCEIRRISYNSPLEFTFYGGVIGLLVAVVLSGGEFEIGRGWIKAKVKPLGAGLSSLADGLLALERVFRLPLTIRGIDRIPLQRQAKAKPLALPAKKEKKIAPAKPKNRYARAWPTEKKKAEPKRKLRTKKKRNP